MGTRAEVDPQSQPGNPSAPRDRGLRVGTRPRLWPDQPPVRRPVRTAAEVGVEAKNHEVLLDDAVRLAGQAASADVAVTLDMHRRGCPTSSRAFHAILDEGAAALDRTGQFLSADLAGAEAGVTGEPAVSS